MDAFGLLSVLSIVRFSIVLSGVKIIKIDQGKIIVANSQSERKICSTFLGVGIQMFKLYQTVNHCKNAALELVEITVYILYRI